MKRLIKVLLLIGSSFFLLACQNEDLSSSLDSLLYGERRSQEMGQEEANSSSPVEKSRPLDSSREERKEVSFYGVGDNLIHSYIYLDVLQADGSYQFAPIYENLKPEIQASDLAYLNQETLIGGDERGFSGYPQFNTPSDMRQALVETGFDLVSAANNHCMDMGGEAAQDSIDLWREYEEDIIFTGIFESQEDRDNFPVFEKNGISFSFLAYTYGTNGIPLDEEYRTNIIEEGLIKKDVKKAKQLSDFVIVAMHWGNENSFEISDEQTKYAQLLADLGVDVVVGCHPHNLQAIEWLEGKEGNETLVSYSLGNFLASPYKDMNSIGGALQFDFVEEKGDHRIENVRLQPIVIHYDYAKGTRGNFKLYNLQDYSADLSQVHGHGLTLEYYYTLVDQVIDEEFLPESIKEGIEKHQAA